MFNRRGKQYSYFYDAANRQYLSSTPASKFTSTDYYANNLVKEITEHSYDTTALTYNARNLLESKADPVGTTTYLYDQSGLVKTVTEGSAVISRTYDERGRLKTFTTADFDLIQFKYDANNNLTRIVYPADTAHPTGRQVNYTYNSRNLLETVTDWSNRVTTYSYDRLGRLIGTLRPNSTSNQIAFDAAGQLISIKENSGGKLISYLAFQYDAASQIKSRFRAPLVNSGWQHPTFNATYDDDNRLLTANGSSVTYDGDGNMTNGPVNPTSGNIGLMYNARNQLTSAAGVSYVYDAEGRRRSLTDTTGTTRDVIDSSGRLLIRTKNGAKTFYVHGAGLLYEVDKAEVTKTYHFDQVGSTIARTDGAGKVIGRAEYSAFGISFWNEGDMATPFLYNGQSGVQTDSNGLLNLRARYYSAYLMRFLNADPIGFSGGSNWFAYADGNPISKSDPFGLDAIFLYGANTNGDPNFFRKHTEVQAAQFNAQNRTIVGYTTMQAHHSPSPLVPIYGEPSERAYVFSAKDTQEFNTALTSVSDISNITYNGHSYGLGQNIDLDALNRTNVNPDAKIYLNGCYTGLDDNNSGSFSAQRYADAFGLSTRGITEGVSFGIPIPHVFTDGYTDLSPGLLRGSGGMGAPDYMWATPKTKNGK